MNEIQAEMNETPLKSMHFQNLYLYLYRNKKCNNFFESIFLRLSNNFHNVYTGVTLVRKDISSLEKLKVHTFYEASKVKMAELSDEVIQAYVDSGEPLDKAGSYGIQGLGRNLFILITRY